MTIPKRIQVCEHTDERAERTDRWWFPDDSSRGAAFKATPFVHADVAEALAAKLRAIRDRNSVNNEDYWLAREALEAYEASML